jgi:hypothetical protein
MKKIRVTITMTEEEAEWLEQICFIEDDFPWQKFINRVGKTVRRARHAFQQSAPRLYDESEVEEVAVGEWQLKKPVAAEKKR